MLIMLKGVLGAVIVMAISAAAMWLIWKLVPGQRRLHKNSEARRR